MDWDQNSSDDFLGMLEMELGDQILPVGSRMQRLQPDVYPSGKVKHHAHGTISFNVINVDGRGGLSTVRAQTRSGAAAQKAASRHCRRASSLMAASSSSVASHASSSKAAAATEQFRLTGPSRRRRRSELASRLAGSANPPPPAAPPPAAG